MRLESSNKSTNELAVVPHKFGQIRYNATDRIIIPSTTSVRRNYIPIGFVESEIIISNLAYYIPASKLYLFGVINSRCHVLWIKTIAGKLKSDYRYTSGLCYNTFPFPPISQARKEELVTHTFRILEEREKHPEKTLAQLYDPDKMPDGLREAHRLNDLAVERCYRSKPFESDEERLEYLSKLYEKMIQEEKDRETLFQKEKKSRKKKKK